LRLVIDAGAWMLLRAQGGGQDHWLGLWRDRCGSAWSPLRAALYWPVAEAAAAAPLPPPDSAA
jgi:hypothetical protein